MERTDQPNVRLRKVKHRLRRRRLRRCMLLLPVILIALLVLLSALCIPVLQVHGTSMSPALNNEETVAVLWQPAYTTGDIIAFECQGQLLTRRVIAGPGSLVDIDSTGNVTVDGILLSEPYVTDKALGVCSTPLPCRVPEGHYFVLGDRRSTSVDSRSTIVGCVSEEDIIGRVFWILQPWKDVRAVN